MSPTQTAEFPRETGLRGEFIRQPSVFRAWVTADGSSGFQAEPGRYHLYVSSACPWAHRTIIYRSLKGLEQVVGMTVVDPIRDQRGWRFTGAAGSDKDELNGFDLLAQAYEATDPAFCGRITVPVLWDRRRRRIVNNESADIIRMLDAEFSEWASGDVEYYPSALRDEILRLNERVYTYVNNGVYRAGFATTQQAYEDAVVPLFETLDWLDERLATSRYLCGEQITEADWRLFTTLVRFDAVYVGHFRCNLRRIVDYPHLWPYLRDLYQQPGVAATVNMDHIKRHYYVTHRSINPHGVVPVGPDLDFLAPHGRDALGCRVAGSLEAGE